MAKKSVLINGVKYPAGSILLPNGTVERPRLTRKQVESMARQYATSRQGGKTRINLRTGRDG